MADSKSSTKYNVSDISNTEPQNLIGAESLKENMQTMKIQISISNDKDSNDNQQNTAQTPSIIVNESEQTSDSQNQPPVKPKSSKSHSYASVSTPESPKPLKSILKRTSSFATSPNSSAAALNPASSKEEKMGILRRISNALSTSSQDLKAGASPKEGSATQLTPHAITGINSPVDTSPSLEKVSSPIIERKLSSKISPESSALLGLPINRLSASEIDHAHNSPGSASSLHSNNSFLLPPGGSSSHLADTKPVSRSVSISNTAMYISNDGHKKMSELKYKHPEMHAESEMNPNPDGTNNSKSKSRKKYRRKKTSEPTPIPDHYYTQASIDAENEFSPEDKSNSDEEDIEDPYDDDQKKKTATEADIQAVLRAISGNISDAPKKSGSLKSSSKSGSFSHSKEELPILKSQANEVTEKVGENSSAVNMESPSELQGSPHSSDVQSLPQTESDKERKGFFSKLFKK